MANYETLFDTSTVPFQYGLAAMLLLIGLICILWGFARLRRMIHDSLGYIRAFKDLMLIVAGFGVFLFIGNDWWEYQSLQSAAGGGEGAQQVEGIVQGHGVKEQTRETSDEVKIEMVEHFRISNVEFEFAQTKGMGRFFTNATGVKLRDGMRLRVAYIETAKANKIVKLEVAR